MALCDTRPRACLASDHLRWLKTPGADVPDLAISISNPSVHSMGDSLPMYVDSRVHELVDAAKYRRILVVGSYNRGLLVSGKEKTGKRENWQRPTAHLEGGELRIHCFPGRAYVFHYGSLIATHLALTHRDPTLVRISLPPPSRCWNEIIKAGFTDLRATNTLIIASGNDRFAPAASMWVDHGTFETRSAGQGAGAHTWLAVKHSFWGDIAYHLGKAVASAGFRRVVFVGKLGSLVPSHQPNITLATGSASMLGGEHLSWANIFRGEQRGGRAF